MIPNNANFRVKISVRQHTGTALFLFRTHRETNDLLVIFKPLTTIKRYFLKEYSLGLQQVHFRVKSFPKKGKHD